MKKILTATVAVATLAAALAIPTDASAQRRWRGPALGAFAAGAIIGGALAARSYYPQSYYGPGPVYYYEPGPVQYEYYGDYYQSSDPCWRQTHGDRQAPCGN